MKGCVTYYEVIRDTVRVRLMHKEMILGLEKLTDRSLEWDGIHGAEKVDVAGPLTVGGRSVISGIRAMLAISVLTREAI